MGEASQELSAFVCIRVDVTAKILAGELEKKSERSVCAHSLEDRMDRTYPMIECGRGERERENREPCR